MKRMMAAALALGAALALSTSAAAAQYFEFHMTGVITTKYPPWMEPEEPIDIHVGDIIHMDARYSSDRVFRSFFAPRAVALGSLLAGRDDAWRNFAPVLPASGPEYFRVSVNGFGWDAADEVFGGYPMWTRTTTLDSGQKVMLTFGKPLLLLDRNGNFKGLVGQFERDNIPGFATSATSFGIFGVGDYTILPHVPGFSGVWDLPPPPQAAPEPATWALTLVGAAAIGGALRRRRRPVAPA